jgi:hypothetical protein
MGILIGGSTAFCHWDDGSGPALFMNAGTTTLPGGSGHVNLVKWDGTTWTALGGGVNSSIRTIVVHDDGRGEALYVGGDLTQAGGIPVNHIARWDGQQWSALGGGLPGQISPVQALVPLRLGPGTRPDLYAGGYFGWAADLPSLHVARWISCEDPIDSFCPGDGSYASCPCLRYSQGPPNNGVPGHGCDNSQFTGGALLQANGSPVPDSIVLRATGELPTALTIFLQGNQVLTAPTPFGDGLRCIGGSLKRLYTKSAVAGTVSAPQGAELSVTARSAALGDPIAPGSLRYYQTYYRDPNPSIPYCAPPAGSTFNSSNGVRIVW